MTNTEIAPYAAQLLDMLPSGVFLVDRDVRLRYANAFGESMIGEYFSEAFDGKFGDALKCVHSFEGSTGCGSSHSCRLCRIRNSVKAVYAEKRKIREESEILTRDGKKYSVMLNASMIRVNGEDLVMLFFEDLREVRQLQDLLPICMKCHKVRNSDSYWQSVDSYLREHTGVNLSHGLCDDCLERYYPIQKEST